MSDCVGCVGCGGPDCAEVTAEERARYEREKELDEMARRFAKTKGGTK